MYISFTTIGIICIQSLTFTTVGSATDLKCFAIRCDGEGCLYDTITNADGSAPSCTATGTDSCYIERQHTSSGIVLNAGCGTCSSSDLTANTDAPTTRPVTTPAETTTWSEWGRLKRSTGGKTCCNENYCNHDSPCGSLTCAADLPTSRLLMPFLTMGLIYLISSE